MKQQLLKPSYLITISLLIITTLLSACATDPETGEQRLTKAGMGATLGAAGGALIGSSINNSKGALIGAGIGAIAGAAVGSDMDRQETMLRARMRSTGVTVERRGRDIRLTMPSDITFGNDKAEIRPEFYRTLNELAHVLRRFRGNTIQVAGFTSSTGSTGYNQTLSERRAENVAEYLVAQGVNPRRVDAVGFGKRYPIASNATTRGQAKNRRVEVTIHSA